MANNDDSGPKKPPVAPPEPASGPPKKPSALLDLKASGVKITESVGGEDKAEAARASQAPPASSVPHAAGAAGGRTGQPSTLDTKAAGSATAGAGSPPSSASSNMSPPPRKPDRASATSFLTHLAAGVAGGMLALIAADSLSFQIGGPQPAATALTGELSDRIALIEKRTTSALPSGALASLEKRLASAEQRIETVTAIEQSVAALRDTQGELAARLAATTAPEPAALERIGRLEETLRTLAAAGASETGNAPGRTSKLAAITGKVADLETALANRIAALRMSVDEELERRTAKIAEASEEARSGTLRIDRELTGLKSSTGKLSDNVSTLAADHDRTSKSLAELKADAVALNTALDTMRGRVEKELQSLQPLTRQVTGIEQNLEAVASRETIRQANVERALLALELASLRRAVESGQPFVRELAEVRRTAGASLDLAALEQYKDRGVPPARALAADFGKLAHQIIAAETSSDQGTLFDRFLSGAKAVVRVRRVGENVEGSNAEAIVARMEAALEAGQFDKVLAEARALPDSARTPSVREWLQKVEAREASFSALHSVEQQLKAGLASATGSGPVTGTGQPGGKGAQ